MIRPEQIAGRDGAARRLPLREPIKAVGGQCPPTRSHTGGQEGAHDSPAVDSVDSEVAVHCNEGGFFGEFGHADEEVVGGLECGGSAAAFPALGRAKA